MPKNKKLPSDEQFWFVEQIWSISTTELRLRNDIRTCLAG